MKDKNKIPETLEEAFEHLERDADPKDLKKWAAMDENRAMGEVHHGLGTAIRNDWGLWFDTSPLHKHLNTFGIKCGDDVSGIIFTSFHRKMNGKDINMEEQLKVYWAHWLNENHSCEDYWPTKIKGTEDKYLKMFEEFKKELDGKR